jgi:hypothetical protein
MLCLSPSRLFDHLVELVDEIMEECAIGVYERTNELVRWQRY